MKLCKNCANAAMFGNKYTCYITDERVDANDGFDCLDFVGDENNESEEED